MKPDLIYNNVLIKSRNIELFESSNIDDTLENKITILLINFSFIFNKLRNYNLKYNQIIFDYIFLKIETDLRELGYGDMSINKKMKKIVNKFYCILLKFDNFLLINNNEIKIKMISSLISVGQNTKKLSKYNQLFQQLCKKH